MKYTSSGFSLIELMIVVAIIGILASIAIPNYKEYILRTDASNSLAVSRPLQLAVSEYAARYSSLPTDCASDLFNYSGISCVAAAHAGGKISSVAIGTDGEITLTFGREDGSDLAPEEQARGTKVPQELATTTFILTPVVNTTNGMVSWSISAGTLPRQYLPKM